VRQAVCECWKADLLSWRSSRCLKFLSKAAHVSCCQCTQTHESSKLRRSEPSWPGDCSNTSGYVGICAVVSLLLLSINLILVTAIGGRTTPEMCFCLGGWGEPSCPRSASVIHSVALGRTPNLSMERRTLYNQTIATQMNYLPLDTGRDRVCQKTLGGQTLCDMHVIVHIT